MTENNEVALIVRILATSTGVRFEDVARQILISLRDHRAAPELYSNENGEIRVLRREP